MICLLMHEKRIQKLQRFLAQQELPNESEVILLEYMG